MKVHKSNFLAFKDCLKVCIENLSTLAKEKNLISYYDLGSGYVNEMPYSLGKDEPSNKKLVKSGVNLLSFSGDKLFWKRSMWHNLGQKRANFQT